MSDVAQEEPDVDTPVNPYSLLEAVNRSSDTAHTGWLIFLLVMAYLMIAVAGVTHRDLLLEKPVQLPIFGIEIPQVQFFQFAPVLLVLFHLGIVTQLVLLARKTLEFDLAVQQLESTSRRTHPLRLELHNFFFVQAIAGPHRSIIMGAFLHGMSWLTLVAIPILLLLFVQIKFLPYHDEVITWSHRIALGVDILMMTLIGVFLVRPEAAFFSAFGKTLISHPVTVVVTTVVFAIVTLFSFFVATIPGEALDRYVTSKMRDTKLAASASADAPILVGFAIPFVAVRDDGSLFGVFHRNLIVTDVDLVPNDQVTEGEPTLSLRGRDLRYARLDRSDLHQADLTGANLDGASLVGTDLRDVRFQCADVTIYILTDDRKAANCPSARGANFTRALLSGAKLRGIDLRGAKLEEADLRKASLDYSILVGTNFASAKLQKADITGGVQAQGVNFLIASLEGADLTGAQLQAADFSNANMQGALLAHAHLEGAVLRDANLDGADLQNAFLRAADLTGASLKAADLRWVSVWNTLPPSETALQSADLSSVKVAPLTDDQREKLKATLRGIGDEELRKLVAGGEALRLVVDPALSRKWTDSAERRIWTRLIETSQIVAAGPLYGVDLSTTLAQLACQGRWSDGSVATGLAKRVGGQQFRGDVATFFAQITAADCTPAQNMDKQLKDNLGFKVGTSG
ncbi:MAG: pentapeptide repeat-containing protein [Pseudomonadota bacterium]